MLVVQEDFEQEVRLLVARLSLEKTGFDSFTQPLCLVLCVFQGRLVEAGNALLKNRLVFIALNFPGVEGVQVAFLLKVRVQRIKLLVAYGLPDSFFEVEHVQLLQFLEHLFDLWPSSFLQDHLVYARRYS